MGRGGIAVESEEHRCNSDPAVNRVSRAKEMLELLAIETDDPSTVIYDRVCAELVDFLKMLLRFLQCICNVQFVFTVM